MPIPESSSPALSQSSSVIAQDLAYRQRHVADLTLCVIAENDVPANASQWLDIFCNECGSNECLDGTAAQLAEKIFDLGWHVEDATRFTVICSACADR